MVSVHSLYCDCHLYWTYRCVHFAWCIHWHPAPFQSGKEGEGGKQKLNINSGIKAWKYFVVSEEAKQAALGNNHSPRCVSSCSLHLEESQRWKARGSSLHFLFPSSSVGRIDLPWRGWSASRLLRRALFHLERPFRSAWKRGFAIIKD